jgi:hypothetical protein
MIVALIALLVALGGTAVAAGGLINGAKIKNGTIAGKKLKKNTLTGTQINESSLAQVPSAASAQNAAHALSADSAAHATSADSAANATNAAHATNADTLGGTGPSGYVAGGGKEFSAGMTLVNNSASKNIVDVPAVGTLTATCPGGLAAVSLTNGTGATVDDEYTIFQNGAISLVNGGAVANANPLVTLGSAVGAQSHVMFAWPDGAPTHFVDMTIGYYQGASQSCVIQVHGTAS